MLAVKRQVLEVLLDEKNSKGVTAFLPYAEISIDRYLWGKVKPLAYANYAEAMAEECSTFR
jgi:hypothetical protein